MSAHPHHGADAVVTGELPRATGRDEHHADDRRAAGAARHLHGRAAAEPARDRRDLPRETAAAEPTTPTPQIVLEYTGDRRLSINQQNVAVVDLEARLRTVFEIRSDKTLFIIAAGSLRYGDVVQVIDAAKGAGVQKVGVVTEGMRAAAARR